MLGQEQLREVKEWVTRTREEGRMAVLVSGVPVTRNWSGGGDEMDSWAVSRKTSLLSVLPEASLTSWYHLST